MATVGIPRALLYYQYYPMWRTFFETLGAEVVVSPPTTKGLLAAGSSQLVAETCLPTKVFCGHVVSLADKVDYVFVPAIRSIEPNVYNCSKFLGLPDLVTSVFEHRPEVLTIDIDVNLGRGSLFKQVHDLGSRFIRNPLRIKRAWDQAQAADREFQSLMRQGLTSPEAITRLYGEEQQAAASDSGRFDYNLICPIRVAVVGHPYNIYDAHINHNLLARLRAWGVEVVTAEMASEKELDEGTMRIVGHPYWTYEDEVVGAAGHYMRSDAVDGVIAVVCFGCGPDSVMLAMVQRYAKEEGSKPLLCVTLDEHTAEAGLVTRLEAFVDMLARRKLKGLHRDESSTGEREQ